MLIYAFSYENAKCVQPNGFSPLYRCLHVRKGKYTGIGGQIGRTLVMNVLSVNGGGGTGGVAVITAVESMTCLGECMWMCVKERPWKI